MEFVPLWTDILDAPCWKVLDLPADVYRFWTLCLLSAQKYDYLDGFLPDLRTLAFWCHMDQDECSRLREKLLGCGLIDRVTSAGRDRDMPVTGHARVTNRPCDADQFKVHDWDNWRAVKDAGAKGRKRKQRERSKGLTQESHDESRNGHADVTVKSRDVTDQISDSRLQTSDNTHPPTPRDGGNVCACDPAPPPGAEDLEPFQAPIDPPQAVWTPEQRRVLDKAAKWWGASNGIEIVGELLGIYATAMTDEAIDAHHGMVGKRIDRGRLEGLCRKIYNGGQWRPKAAGKFNRADEALPTPRIYGSIAGP